MPISNFRGEAGARQESGLAAALHRGWQVSAITAIVAGLFHLINLVEFGRFFLGPLLLTPFRIAFFLAWLFLLAEFIAARRWPRPDRFDLVVASLALIFLLRAAFYPPTLGTVINLIITGAGCYFLIKFGVRDRRDLRLVLLGLAAASLGLALLGLAEYAFKANPLFDAIQIEAVGVDERVAASAQFYRIRSLVGHPGFVGSIMLAAAPLTLLVFWRRRWLMALSLLTLAAAIFFTFSRGSWMLAFFVLLPAIAFRARFWIRRNSRWVLPLALLPLALLAFDYWNREAVTISLGRSFEETGLSWRMGGDGPVVLISGEADGVQPYNKFLYFDIDDSFYRADDEPVTIVVRYFDKDLGAIRLDYDAWDETLGELDGAFAPTHGVSKTDTRQWTSTAFYIKHPRFNNRQNEGSDFRIVDEDSSLIVDEVTLQKGKLKLPAVVLEQWFSRSGSLNTRVNLYPFAWGVLQDNPWGVGLFNSPGTDHHAVDSLPLTWLMEFGWLALPLLGALLLLLLLEAMRVWRRPQGLLAVLLVSLLLMLMHGGHLMIVYDKPSLVMIATVTALYAAVRPWRQGGAVIDAASRDCMI